MAGGASDPKALPNAKDERSENCHWAIRRKKLNKAGNSVMQVIYCQTVSVSLLGLKTIFISFLNVASKKLFSELALESFSYL